MRVLHVIAGIPVESGGPALVLREMTARLAELGHDVVVLTTDAGGSGRRVGSGDRGGIATGVGLDMHRVQLAWSPYFSAGQALAAWRAAGDGYDVAHVHGLFATPVSLAMAAFRARGLPYVLRPCGMLDDYSLGQRAGLKRAWMALGERANLEGAARVQASTEHEADAVRAVLPERLHGRVVVLPQGVARPAAGSGARLHTRPYVLFLSRIAKKKGLVLLVEAFAKVAALRPELDLVLVGPDEHGHRAEVLAAIDRFGLVGRVMLMGAATGAAKSDWFAGAEVFVLPSDDENFGVVVIEAAHFGVPLVVSDRVGLGPAIVRHDAGRVTLREAGRLADAIVATLERGRAEYAPGLRTLAGEFDWGPLGLRLEALYRECLVAKRASRS